MRNVSVRSACHLAGLVLLACGFLGCQRAPSTPPSAAAARVNGKEIPRAEVEKYFRVRTYNQPQKPTGDAEKALRLEVLRELIMGEIMAQKAAQLKLQPTEAQVDAEVRNLKGNVSEAEFKMSLDQRGLTDADFRRDISRNLAVQKLIENQVGSKAQVTEADTQRFYDDNKNNFLVQEPQYRVGVIVVAERPNSGAANPAAGFVQGAPKIRVAAARLQGGEDFGQVARQLSEDPQTAQAGGDLGYQPAAALDRLGPAPKAALLKMKVGEVSPVLEIAGAYLIVKLSGKREPGQLTLENPEVKQAVQEELQTRRQELLRSAFTEQLHNEARVENFLAQEILAEAPKAK